MTRKPDEKERNSHIWRRGEDSSTEYDSSEESRLLTKGTKRSKSQEEAAASGDGSKGKFPKAIYYILGNEFCERFTFYGIRTISSLYLTQYLLFNETTSTVIFHFFVMLAYFTPILGAILADSWLGKYKTIMYLSLLYAVGNIILAAGAIPASLQTMRVVSILGFIVVGTGTGGIKPCVAAFGGDQFSHNQEAQRKTFFSIFYFIINFGSMLSTIITPELRADVQCFGQTTCYPLAFGVPALLMIVSIVFFFAGRSLYTMVPVAGNAVVKVCKCICSAVAKRFNSSDKKKEHWLDYAEGEYEKTFIEDVKSLLHVLWIFLPLPIFWSLFDQTSSRWTLQATRMDGEFYGMHIKADQIQAVNPIMILVFIPIFDYAVYPLFKKCNLLTKPLQKMTVGGFIAAISFVMAGMLEMSLESAMPVVPEHGYSEFSIINNSPCDIYINGTVAEYISPFEYKIMTNLPLDKDNQWMFKPSNCSASNTLSKTFTSDSMYEIAMININNGQIQVDKVNDKKQKDKSGKPRIRFFFSTDVTFEASSNASFKFVGEDGTTTYLPINIDKASKFGSTDYMATKPGIYKIYAPINDTDYSKEPIGERAFRSGGSYLGIVYQSSSPKESTLKIFNTVQPNSIHILWQIPQYIVLTAGEIMFSITGLEFSYSQAPLALKSVVQSAWLCTVAVGNVIVMIIAELEMFEKASYELLLFAVLMAVDMVIFMIMAYFYKYKNVHTQSQEDLETVGSKKKRNEDETHFNK